SLQACARRLGEPLPTLAATVPYDVPAALVANPAKESMHAAAVSLLGLEGSLHDVDRGSVPNHGICDRKGGSSSTPSVSLHRISKMPCDTTGAVLQSPPGSQASALLTTSQYRSPTST